MIESRRSRVTALCVLLGTLVGVMIWFGVPTPPDPQLGQVPTANHLATDTDTYVGQHVQVTGTVVRTDPVVVETGYELWTGQRYRTGSLEVTVTGLATDVTPGQTLQVYGILGEDRTIDATNSSARPAVNRLFMFVVSGLAGLWVLARLVSGWTVDWDTLAIEPRSEPIAQLTSPRSQTPEDTTDA